jgi:hypothetical protein
MVSSWVLILFIYAHKVEANELPDRAIESATTASFYTEAACNAAGQDVLSHFPGRVTWLCEPGQK